MIGEILGAAWESLTLGELVLGLGGLAGGGGLVVVGKQVTRALGAVSSALDKWGRHLEATTAAARAGAHLSPLLAAVLRAYLRERNAPIPPLDDESDELHVLRVAALGDDAELEALSRQLEHDGDASLSRRLTRTEQRLVELLRASKARKRADNVPRPRARSTSWLRRRAEKPA